MSYSELIKSFHRIRPYMRSFYVYGFRHRMDHDKKSARSYDNERRRIESWLGDYLKFSQDSDGKRVFLSVDSRAIKENPLYQAYKAKSFTDRDIMLHFFLMDILDTECGMTMIEVMDELNDYLFEMEDLLPDESSVRKKLKEYENIGLVRKEKQGKKVLYYLEQDHVNLDSWTDALDYFSEAAPLGVIGSYIRSIDHNNGIDSDNNADDDFIDDYVDDDFSDEEPVSADRDKSDLFRFKHHYILNALDSEILYNIFLAMEDGKTVILQKTHFSEEMIPLKIYISTRTGRQYVLGKTLQGFRFFRLDLLDKVKEGNPVEISDEIFEELAVFQRQVWGTSRKDTSRTEHIEFIIHVETDEQFIINRLEREKRCGILTDLGEGNWKFSADVYDAREMLPWVRTFIGRIVSLETDNAEVEQRFHEDIRAMQQMYDENGGGEDALF